MAELILALGSNIGNRQLYIRQALDMLDVEISPRKACSPVEETEALGFDGPPFLNCVASYDTSLPSAKVLEICKMIEKRLGRSDRPEYDEEGKRIYHDRTIDIDILSYGDVTMDTPELRIPHPQVEERPYIRRLLGKLIPND